MYQFLRDESGTAAMEYSLFVSLIGLVVTGAFLAVGVNLFDAFSSISDKLPSVVLSVDLQEGN